VKHCVQILCTCVHASYRDNKNFMVHQSWSMVSYNVMPKECKCQTGSNKHDIIGVTPLILFMTSWRNVGTCQWWAYHVSLWLNGWTLIDSILVSQCNILTVCTRIIHYGITWQVMDLCFLSQAESKLSYICHKWKLTTWQSRDTFIDSWKLWVAVPWRCK
jgi:hypothetical protein